MVSPKTKNEIIIYDTSNNKKEARIIIYKPERRN